MHPIWRIRRILGYILLGVAALIVISSAAQRCGGASAATFSADLRAARCQSAETVIK